MILCVIVSSVFDFDLLIFCFSWSSLILFFLLHDFPSSVLCLFLPGEWPQNQPLLHHIWPSTHFSTFSILRQWTLTLQMCFFHVFSEELIFSLLFSSFFLVFQMVRLNFEYWQWNRRSGIKSKPSFLYNDTISVHLNTHLKLLFLCTVTVCGDCLLSRHTDEDVFNSFSHLYI